MAGKPSCSQQAVQWCVGHGFELIEWDKEPQPSQNGGGGDESEEGTLSFHIGCIVQLIISLPPSLPFPPCFPPSLSSSPSLLPSLPLFLSLPASLPPSPSLPLPPSLSLPSSPSLPLPPFLSLPSSPSLPLPPFLSLPPSPSLPLSPFLSLSPSCVVLDDFPESTGVERMSEALQAHVWPDMTMKSGAPGERSSVHTAAHGQVKQEESQPVAGEEKGVLSKHTSLSISATAADSSQRRIGE